MLTTFSTGAAIGFLANAKTGGVFPSIPAVQGSAAPNFKGTPEEYIAKHADAKELEVMLKNKVKKCAGCGKPNAFTLDTCNQCGESLLQTSISFTNNVFTGFAFGIEKGPFPFSISMRHEDDEIIVFDDLLALSPLHFNTVPTRHYMPDWRYLFRRPRDALALVDNMMAKAALASKTFLENEAWASKFLKGGKEAGAAFDAGHVAAGFNYPPSQYQLHIQYIFPAMLPFQFAQYMKGVHFTHKRFFPVEYVTTCLKIVCELEGKKDGFPSALLDPDASVDQFITYFRDAHNYDYDKVHAAFYSDFAKLQAKYSNWSADDFKGCCFGDVYCPHDGKEDATVSAKDLPAQDKMTLQSYGRPYANGRPTGSYYSFPKAPKDITSW